MQSWARPRRKLPHALRWGTEPRARIPSTWMSRLVRPLPKDPSPRVAVLALSKSPGSGQARSQHLPGSTTRAARPTTQPGLRVGRGSSAVARWSELPPAQGHGPQGHGLPTTGPCTRQPGCWGCDTGLIFRGSLRTLGSSPQLFLRTRAQGLSTSWTPKSLALAAAAPQPTPCRVAESLGVSTPSTTHGAAFQGLSPCPQSPRTLVPGMNRPGDSQRGHTSSA